MNFFYEKRKNENESFHSLKIAVIQAMKNRNIRSNGFNTTNTKFYFKLKPNPALIPMPTQA